jgi:iron complex transport system substrate-binding protein
MRIVSLLPSATEIVAALGLADWLVGVSEECSWPPEVAGKPRVTAARISPGELSSAAIDAAVRDSVSDGHSLYTVDAGLIDALRPDLIITQDLCLVCAVASGQLATACPVDTEVISLDPRSLAEVADTARLLGERLGVPAAGDRAASEMEAKIAAVRDAVGGARNGRVFFAEWIDPPFCGGHWVPEMIEAAGGQGVMGSAGEPSFSTSWDAVLAAEPDLVVVAPCGFGTEEAASRAAGLAFDCRAVAVDADSYYSRPAPRLADGVAQLAHLLHPDVVPDPGLPAIDLA